jgi:hypothetical protein
MRSACFANQLNNFFWIQKLACMNHPASAGFGAIFKQPFKSGALQSATVA